MISISSLPEARNALHGIGKVVGLGVNAFPRVGIIPFLDDYQIIAITETADLSIIRRDVSVVTVNGDFRGRTKKLNTLSLLQHQKVQQQLKKQSKGTGVFIYKSSKRIEEIVDRLGLKLLSNRSEVRDSFEDKWKFRQLALIAGLPIPAGAQLLIDEFTPEWYATARKAYGSQLVIQITDYSKGGGIGTFFISSLEDVREFHAFVSRRRKAGRDLQRMNITTRIDGESASISACATRHGILVSRVQRQIVDVHDVVGYHGRSGVFCGHDWGNRYGDAIQKEASKIAQDVGKLMFSKGYRGIFGVDLVVNQHTGDIHLIEVNSRYTAAYPVYTMMQLAHDEIPLDAWHLLEFSDIEYEMDFDEIQQLYERPKVGAQLILHNLERAWVNVGGSVKAGVYSFRSNAKGQKLKSDLEWVREGYRFQDLKSESEFVLTDGVPKRGSKLKPGARLGRLLYRREVMQDDRNELQSEIKGSVQALYSLYGLKRVTKKK